MISRRVEMALESLDSFKAIRLLDVDSGGFEDIIKCEVVDGNIYFIAHTITLHLQTHHPQTHHPLTSHPQTPHSQTPHSQTPRQYPSDVHDHQVLCSAYSSQHGAGCLL